MFKYECFGFYIKPSFGHLNMPCNILWILFKLNFYFYMKKINQKVLNILFPLEAFCVKTAWGKLELENIGK